MAEFQARRLRLPVKVQKRTVCPTAFQLLTEASNRSPLAVAGVVADRCGLRSLGA